MNDETGKSLRWAYLLASVAILAGAAILIGIDQWTKQLAVKHLVPGQSVSVLSAPVVGDVCLLMLVWNTGAFLSLGAGLDGILRFGLMIIVPVGALLAMAGYLLWPLFDRRKVPVTLSLRLALMFGMAGGGGNLVDRIAQGKVVDFLNFGIGPVRTGIMNVADLYILGALIALAVYWFRRRGAKGGLTDGTPPAA